ncbi:bacteriohemerythrin [Desulfopila aestuarii]|uniref:Hemerythrin n=1 Tax=Desulfopila aestuarii DSM 18488 TaxID=1121416 RepID=A0A1M7Y9W9_9BACT|nr:bacteriohemerythrin [Desulfopila aestuarii]SHO49407.1 hemerythrin [Desulfopila aestuarii DSM 18488]
MDIIKWRDSYETGIAEMDNQHRQLIQLINQLYGIIKEKDGFESVDAILQEMANYAEHHLRDEEKLLEEHGFPGLADQQKSHRNYFMKMDELQEAMEKDGRDAAQEIYVFLRQWWINHIVLEDKEYGPYLRGKGLK